MLALVVSFAGVLVALPAPPDAPGAPGSPGSIVRLDSGVVLPYALDNIFRGWVECTELGPHPAIDLGGVGPDEGLGTPVRSMGRAKVTQIGDPDVDPARFGELIKDRDTVERGQHVLPAFKEIPGYGRVYFFTSTYGQLRTGRYIATRILDGPLAGMTARYMHLGAVHPALEVGSVVFAGQELGLLGGTAVLEASPHVHIQLETPEQEDVDLGVVLGMGPTRVPCNATPEVVQAIRVRYLRGARQVMTAARTRATRPQTVARHIGGCGKNAITGDFLGGNVSAMRAVLPTDEAALGGAWTVRLTSTRGAWRPRLTFEDDEGRTVFAGAMARPAAKARFAFTTRATGQKARTAEVVVVPHERGPLSVKISAWPATRSALKNARWRLEVSRPCAGR